MPSSGNEGRLEIFLQRLIQAGLMALAGLVLLAGMGTCFYRIPAWMQMDPDQEPTRLERLLPLRGRWLGCLLAAIMGPLALVVGIGGGLLFFGAISAIRHLLSGDR